MDPLSITASCAGLITAIGSLSLNIHNFVRTCREARRDLDRVSRELQSLESVLGLIQDDAADENNPFPPTIGQHISGIVTNCNSVVVEIQSCISEYGDGRMKTRAAWAISGQGDIEKLRTSLEAHKSALELAVDMLALSVTKEIKADTTELRNDTAAIKEDTAQILEEIARLQSRLPQQAKAPNDFMLQRFLEEMTEYTEAVLDSETLVEDSDDNYPGTPREGKQSKVPERKWTPPLSTVEQKQSKVPERKWTPPLSTAEHLTFEPPFFEELAPLSTPTRSIPPFSSSFSEIPLRPRPQLYTSTRTNNERWGLETRASQNLPPSEASMEYKGVNPPPPESPSRKQAETAETLLCNKAVVEHGRISAQSFRGCFTIDFRLPDDLLALHSTVPMSDPQGKRAKWIVPDWYSMDEFAYWRYSVITYPMRDWPALRPSLFVPPRPIQVVLSFRLTPAETDQDFCRRWTMIYEAIETLRADSGNKHIWKQVLVHINGSMNWEGLCLGKALERIGAKQKLPGRVVSLDGAKLRPTYQETDRTLHGERILYTIREATTLLSPNPKPRDIETTVPIQVVATTPHGPSNPDPYGDSEYMRRQVGKLLQPQLVIDMIRFYGRGAPNRFFLAKALQRSWGEGTKYITFYDLLTEMSL